MKKIVFGGLVISMSLLLMVSVFLATPSLAKKAITLHTLWQSGGDIQPVLQLKEEYEKKAGIKLSIEEVPPPNMYEKHMANFLAGTGVYDLIETYPTYVGTFAENGYIMNLDKYFQRYAEEMDLEDYIGTVQVALDKWHGSWYAVPYDGDVLIFYYRKDLFEDPANKAEFKTQYGYELNVPDTWQQVLDIAEFFDRPEENLRGISFIAQRWWGAVDYWFCIYGAYGGGLVDEDYKIRLDKTAFLEADAIWEKCLKYAPEGILGYGYVECKEAICRAKVAMGMLWATGVVLDPRQSDVYNKLGFAVMPGVKQPDGSIKRTPSLAVGKAIVIPADAKHPDEAFEFAKFMSSKEVQVLATTMGSGVDPNRYSVFEDPRVKKMWGDMIPPIMESMEVGIPDMNVNGSGRFYEVITRELHSLWSGEQTAEQAYNYILSGWEVIKAEMGVR